MMAPQNEVSPGHHCPTEVISAVWRSGRMSPMAGLFAHHGQKSLRCGFKLRLGAANDRDSAIDDRIGEHSRDHVRLQVARHTRRRKNGDPQARARISDRSRHLKRFEQDPKIGMGPPNGIVRQSTDGGAMSHGDDLMIRQFFPGYGLGNAPETAARCHGDELIGEDRFMVHGIPWADIAEAKIDFAPFCSPDYFLAHQVKHLDHDEFMLVVETANDVWQQQSAQRGEGGNSKSASSKFAIISSCANRRIHLRKHARTCNQKLASSQCQFRATTIAGEQSCGQFLLKLSNESAKRRLRKPQGLRGAREVRMLRNCAKSTNMLYRDIVIRHICRPYQNKNTKSTIGIYNISPIVLPNYHGTKLFMLKILDGVRIVDLTTVVLGPYATQILGDLGADVIKVEPIDGDVFRAVRPGRSTSMGAGFLNCNRNKRSLAIDLRDEEATAALYRLIATADVVVHNMRPKSARKLGIAFEQLVEINPALVYCYACGFGQEGPLADEPAYDDTIQAVSGFAYLNANANGDPTFIRTIVADKVGGLHLTISVLAALASRDRAEGKPLCIETPMFESMVSFLLVEQLAGMSFQPPLGGIGYDRLLSPYRKPFKTRDGFISIIPYTAAHWITFLRLIGREDLVDDPRVTDGAKRSRSIDMLYALIEQATPDRSTDEWIQALSAKGVPCAHVNRVEDLFDNEHLKAVGMFRTEHHPQEGSLLAVRSPFRVPDQLGEEDRPAPPLGEHSREILRQAGLGEAEIDALVARNAVYDGLTNDGKVA